MSSPAGVIILFVFCISGINCANIGFFHNPGGYSHDACTSYLASGLISSTNHSVSIIEISIFKFIRRVDFSNKFDNLIIHDVSDDAKANQALQTFLKLIWEIVLPFDFENITFNGMNAILQVQQSYMKGCSAAMQNKSFLNAIKDLNLHLLNIHYTPSDCPIGFAHILNIPVVYFSNGPFNAHYIDYTGVPSNPSYVPSFLAFFEPHEDFLGRLINFFGYSSLVVFRYLSLQGLSSLFKETLDLQFPDLNSLERYILMVGSPWEMFLDMPRPIARNLLYFGCEHCISTVEPAAQPFTPPPAALQSKYIEKPVGIILVSFGSLTKVELTPVRILQNFLKAFTKFPRYLIVWQLDVSQEYFEVSVLKPLNMKMPKNIQLSRWVSIKELLRDERVVLLVTHGGAATCLEAAYSGVPILGLAIHSDQFYNAQRMEHRGLGQSLQMIRIEEQSIVTELGTILTNHKWYKAKAVKFRDMLLDYKNFTKSAASFWLDFVARHFGGKADDTSRIQKQEKYWTLRYPSNWIIYHNGDVAVVAFLLCLILLLVVSHE